MNLADKRIISLGVKMDKIIKVRVNDRDTAKLIRKTLMDKGFVKVFCKDFGNKLELGFIRINTMK